VNVRDETLLRERFAELSGPYDAKWDDVRAKARRSSRRTSALLATVAIALVVTGLGFGGEVIGLFEGKGTPVPLSSLSERDRQIAVFSLCRRIELVSRPGRAPLERCRDGVPKVEEIANDGKTFYWKLSYPNGVTCLASGPIRGYHDSNRGDSKIGMLGCNVGAPTQSVVPTPKRPITTDIGLVMNPRGARAHITRASGLAGAGIASVGLIAKDGFVLKTPVNGRTYDFGHAIPVREWVAIVAYDNSGKEVYRQTVSVSPLPRPQLPITPPDHQAPSLLPLPAGQPLQHGETPDATIDVYASKLVAAHFTSTANEVYRRLERSASKDTATIKGPNLACGDVAFGAGRWLVAAGGASVPLHQDLRMTLDTHYGGFPSPPYAYCEVVGTYGRYWNDEEGTHDLVEVPFTATGRRYLDERATARDLAYFVRTRKMWAIRKAIYRGEPVPSTADFVRRFGERVVPLGSRDGTAPLGKIGVWTDERLIVASELTPAGRRLFVTVRAMRIGANNIRDLSFPF
jgi:hypothetical protein